jgi:hypothetical protein
MFIVGIMGLGSIFCYDFIAAEMRPRDALTSGVHIYTGVSPARIPYGESGHLRVGQETRMYMVNAGG